MWMDGNYPSQFRCFPVRLHGHASDEGVAGRHRYRDMAPDATIKGIEADIVAMLTPQFQLDFALGLLNAEFDEFESQNPIYPGTPVQDLAGNKLPVSPEYSGMIGATYTWPLQSGDLDLRGELAFSDEFLDHGFRRRDLRTSQPMSRATRSSPIGATAA